MASNRRRWSWFSVSVRTLMIIVFAVAVSLGWWVNSARNQQAAVAAVRAYDVSANIVYDNDRVIRDYTGAGLYTGENKSSWWVPASLERQLGRDYFHKVDSVAFGQGRPAPGSVRRVDVLRDVARLRNLRQLALYFPVSDAEVMYLDGLRSLKRLEVAEDCPELTDASLLKFSRVPSLEELDIHNAPISDAGLIHLGKMPQLKSLALGEVAPFSSGDNKIAVTGDGFANLADLPNLTSLEIYSAVLTRDGLKHIGALRHLKRLSLKGGSFKDDDLSLLAPLTNLESLSIVGSNIDGTGFRHLAGLSKVEWICLQSPSVTDAAVPFIARLTSLKSIMIYGTRVTAVGLEEFRAAPRLTQMGLRPAVIGDTKRLKQALPNCSILNDGRSL